MTIEQPAMLKLVTGAFAICIVSQSAVAKPNEEVGQWHQVVANWVVSGDKHLPNPPWVIGMNSASPENPQVYKGTKKFPIPVLVDSVNETRQNCGPGDAPPQTNPCDFVDKYSITKIDDHTVGYLVQNHGGRGEQRPYVWLRDMHQEASSGPEQKWIAGQEFSVEVPTGTSATVVGKFRGNVVIFTPGSTLDAVNAKRFQLVATRPVPDSGPPAETIYVYKVKDPDEPQ